MEWWCGAEWRGGGVQGWCRVVVVMWSGGGGGGGDRVAVVVGSG